MNNYPGKNNRSTDLVVAGYIIHQEKVLLVHHRELDVWLPVGGHIDENETPDQALHREIEEEIGIDVEILNQSNILLEDTGTRNLAVPFYVNVHSVGDHDHCCLFYICKAINPERLKISSELKGFDWFTKDDLQKEHVTVNVKKQCLKALEFYKE